MSRFREELRVIPRRAKVIAALIAIGMAVLMSFLVNLPTEGEPMPLEGKVILPILGAAVGFVLVMLIGYVYGDAKRRGMRYVMWTLLAIFVPDGIGIILYFILRDPLPTHCTACGTALKAHFAFCPHCGAALHPACPQCGKAVEPQWSHCGYCGARLPAATPSAAA